ncbi:MAG: HEAT repeat domain-containing protein [Thermodesulfobacteriota bacterium]|nr:HEAT repeat domain-containing protein [Thermodesulfobacteriota bacterium]
MDTIHDQTIEHALIGLTKLLKNVSYYPDGHPSLNLAINQGLQLFSAVTSRNQEALVLSVSRQGFAIDEHPLEIKNPLPKNLAHQLFSHKIKSLTILPGLVDHHLLAFARLLNSEPSVIAAQGGAQDLLDRQRISTIAINELNLAAVRNRQQAIERGQPTPLSSASDSTGGASNNSHQPSTQQASAYESTQSLNELIQRLNEILRAPAKKRETLFLQGLTQLIQTLQPIISSGNQKQAISVLRQLDSWIQNPSSPKRYVSVLKQAVQSLGGRPLLDLLMDNVKTASMLGLTRRIISLLDDDISTILVDRLGNEIDPKLRKFISQLLVNMGQRAFVPLINSLDDERWFVVRNAVTILSESRSEQLIPEFINQLHHPDGRVVNEAIRALSRIKVNRSSQELLYQLESGQCDFPNQIILALGALADPIAVPQLLRIATQHDPLLNKKPLIKVAITALGEISDATSARPLIHLMQRFKLLKRKEYNEIRCQAASALGHFNDADSLKALEKASNSAQRNLATAARQALRLHGTA